MGFEPGGNTDMVARVVAQKLGERLGQQVIVENKAGAGGTIANAEVARAAPDGYTLTMGTTTTHAIAVAAYQTLQYDPAADFEPIALVAVAPYLLVVPPKYTGARPEGVRRAREVAAGQAELRLGGPGDDDAPRDGDLRDAPGSTWCTCRSRATRPRPPPSSAARSRSCSAAAAAPAAREGGQAAADRDQLGQALESLPDVPTVAESGYPGFDIALWLGFFAPKGTPAAITKRLESELLGVAQSADLKDVLEKQGLEARRGALRRARPARESRDRDLQGRLQGREYQDGVVRLSAPPARAPA